MTLAIALPSKGRLREKSLQLLQQAGYDLQIPQDGRGYKARAYHNIRGEYLDILFLSASEIARELGRGNVDLGITGEDLIRETLSRCDEKVRIELPLGFGQADVVVAVPKSWHDVDCMADLDDVAADFRQRHDRRLRIATKYWRLTQQFFSGKHNIGVYRIVESLGATEGTPAAGSADIIVDITSTGSTLAANWLKILDDGVILRSQACLVSSRLSKKASPFSQNNSLHAQNIATLRKDLEQFSGQSGHRFSVKIA